ncbi:hypothetical protein DEU56DRAFT_759215 [Suillus clintonianus]|uniref:uncharacterized protein n=1 Tax=Suillus clintonianus TaxID=1904413 RepID=UPI001B85CA96|nr:uncharacterized protein DEU56DRAFT_759215 [Suillus clintonianus]KAG2125478.1 hypothetical protein DEU56DRAFT_759215 [Suillus clintonianus]
MENSQVRFQVIVHRARDHKLFDEMQPNVRFLSLVEELQFYILCFLPYRDILRCTSVCKALRQTYLSSSELQYIVELGGQCLLPVPNTDNHTPISERLRLLRNKAHAWFKVDIHSSKTTSVPPHHACETSLTDGHFYMWNRWRRMASIIPILPKPSQRTIQRDWFRETLCSVPNSTNLRVFMDPAQDLKAVFYVVDRKTTYIDLRALDVDGVHPHAAGPTLFVSELPGCDKPVNWNLKGFGSYIALLLVYDEMWQLQIWDWKRSTTSNSVLGDEWSCGIDFCFLGNNRWLVVSDNLKLYSTEDMSQTPKLLACFMLPVQFKLPGHTACLLPVDDSARSSRLQMQVQQTMYTSDPKHRLLCITTYTNSSIVYIISTRIFFDLDDMAVAMPIPWKCWGPSNTRIFWYPLSPYHDEFKIHLSGNRVLLLFPVRTPLSDNTISKLRIMDFSPLAVTNRRGLGRVVREPSTLDLTDLEPLCDESEGCLTTFLPYIEVVLDRKFRDLEDIWIDEDRIYLLSDELEVIDV